MALENIRDLLAERVNNLDNGKHDVMTEAKLVIVDLIHVEVRVLSFKYGNLRVATEDSSAASEIRLRSTELLSAINKKLTKEKVQRLSVVVR